MTVKEIATTPVVRNKREVLDGKTDYIHRF